jgi:iron complex transport system substrate-binding protein
MKSHSPCIVVTRVYTYIFILLSGFLFLSCKGKNDTNSKTTQSLSEQVITSARGFHIVKKDNYSLVTIINPWQGAENISMLHYLVKKGCNVPEGADSTQVIFVPVSSIVCMSTTYVGMITALGEENTIIGLSGAEFAYSSEILERVQKGMIEEVGYESNLNQELLIKLSPELVMMYGIGGESAGHVNKIRELGMNIMFNADYLETDPLAKAEWIKLFGALYCKEKMADSIYNREVKEYNQIRDFVIEKTIDRPVVLLGLPFKDTWFVSPGNSFISKLIQDAGGNYLWKNTISSVSMPYGLENVYIAAIDADLWFNIGTVKTSVEISLVDKRLTDLRCFKNGNLFNNNNRITSKGGNDYWESGAIKPHLILKDMASVMHPELFPGYELYYYRKVN